MTVFCSFCGKHSEDAICMIVSKDVAICDACVESCVSCVMDAARNRDRRKTMPYAEYLRTAEWADQRKGALARAEGRCQVCNSGENLHVHHRTYERRGSEYPSDLTVLCQSCHALFHENSRLALAATEAPAGAGDAA